MAMLILFSAFATIILVGSLLVAAHDAIEDAVVRRSSEACSRAPSRSGAERTFSRGRRVHSLS